MEVAILKTFDHQLMKEEIDSYHKTGWQMDGDIKLAVVNGQLLYVQKMVRGEYN